MLPATQQNTLTCGRCGADTGFLSPLSGYMCCPACINELKALRRKQARHRKEVTVAEAIEALNTGKARVVRGR